MLRLDNQDMLFSDINSVESDVFAAKQPSQIRAFEAQILTETKVLFQFSENLWNILRNPCYSPHVVCAFVF